MFNVYDKEISRLKHTFEWARQLEIEGLARFISRTSNTPLLVIGSGGSLTSAHMVVLLHQSAGGIGKVITPLEFELYNHAAVASSSVIIISAGGKNHDVLSAFKRAIAYEPRNLLVACATTNSPLEKLAANYTLVDIFCHRIPFGKDGFLATNSSIYFVTSFILAYQYIYNLYHIDQNYSSWFEREAFLDSIDAIFAQLVQKKTWSLLYAGWSQPAAIDAESKFTEAALKNLQLADFRNFAHGRHHWLAKHGEDTGILALSTPEYMDLADKTLGLLPDNVVTLRMYANSEGPWGGLQLLTSVLWLVGLVGQHAGIDPGRPGVPEFGRRLYHMKRTSSRLGGSKTNIARLEELAVGRKLKYKPYLKTDNDFISWRNAFRRFIKKLESTDFGGLVFDYDGTIWDNFSRFGHVEYEIRNEILRLLGGGIYIGIATGRGKSVRKSLQEFIIDEFNDRVLIGYYNGAQVAYLGDSRIPSITDVMSAELSRVQSRIVASEIVGKYAKFEYRPHQISAEPLHLKYWEVLRNILIDIIHQHASNNIQLVESSHSFDIILTEVSKLKVVDELRAVLERVNKPANVLCVGDKGEWPGNDYQLLSTPYSLSVDSVSSDPLSCWNINPLGLRGVQATLSLLKGIRVEGGVARFHRS